MLGGMIRRLPPVHGICHWLQRRVWCGKVLESIEIGLVTYRPAGPFIAGLNGLKTPRKAAAMRREILAFLQSTARRLLLARALESAAVLAVAAGLCAAALELAWMAAWRRPLVAALICLLPVAGGLAVWALAAVRRQLRIDKEAAVLAAGFSIVVAAAGAICVAMGWHAHLGKGYLPLVVLPAGALVGALVRIFQGVSVQEAAIFLDARGGFGERLSTAAELAVSPDRDKPFAEYVYAQASGVPDAVRLKRPAPWKRSRATAAALGLAAMLCLTLALLPSSRASRRLQDILAGLSDMTADDRAELSSEFRHAARQAQVDPELARQLSRAADAIEISDPEQLEEVLSGIEQSLVSPRDQTAADMSRDLLAAAEKAAGGASASDDATASGEPARQEGGDAAAREQKTHRVLVYDPGYDPAMVEHSPGTGVDPGERGSAGQGMVRKTDAWAAARERAAGALQSGQVPAPYRQLVRDFFLAE